MTIPVHRYTRREALGLLGTAAGAGVVAASTGTLPVEAQQSFTSVDPPSFPSGALIRTLQGDLDPTDLATGATLSPVQSVPRSRVGVGADAVRTEGVEIVA